MGSDAIFARIGPYLSVFERENPQARQTFDDGERRPEYVVVGLGRLGATIMEELEDSGVDVLGVDFDPRSAFSERHDDDVLYGDADDPNLVDALPLNSARWVICAIRAFDPTMTLVRSLRESGYDGGIAVATEDLADCALLLEAGADLAVQPLHVAVAPILEAIVDHDRGARDPAPGSSDPSVVRDAEGG
jgi:voltage-gated potassium channel Kch